jgi:hypothetical protein
LIRAEETDYELSGEEITFTVHIRSDNELYSKKMTQEEYYDGDRTVRDNYLRFGVANPINVDTAKALLYEKFGTHDEVSGYEFSFEFESMKALKGISCYAFRWSRLVDGIHWSYIDEVIVAPDGEIVLDSTTESETPDTAKAA